MMAGNDSELPMSAVKRVVDEVRAYGLQRQETGGFFLSPRNRSSVSVVALSGVKGIGRRHNQFQISALALDRLFTFADERDHWVPVQFHSHRAAAFLSDTDKAHGLCAEGFISTVVPDFQSPLHDITAWGWWRFKAGRWIAIEPGVQSDGDVEVVRFDESGVDAT
jgi:hypothetical protein